MKCPECGSEMKGVRRRKIPKIDPNIIGLSVYDYDQYWECKCGHEEKVKP